MTGGCVARIVPSSGIVTLASREQLEQERLEVVVGAVDLVDQQHGRAAGPGCSSARSSGRRIR